jgi:hypothetical protein
MTHEQTANKISLVFLGDTLSTLIGSPQTGWWMNIDARPSFGYSFINGGFSQCAEKIHNGNVDWTLPFWDNIGDIHFDREKFCVLAEYADGQVKQFRPLTNINVPESIMRFIAA